MHFEAILLLLGEGFLEVIEVIGRLCFRHNVYK